MKKVCMLSILVLMVSLVGISTALARSMTVVNKSGAVLVALNISQAQGDNVSNLLEKPLAKGKSFTVQLDNGNTGWSVLAIDDANTAHVGEALNFSGKSKIIVSGGKITLQ